MRVVRAMLSILLALAFSAQPPVRYEESVGEARVVALLDAEGRVTECLRGELPVGEPAPEGARAVARGVPSVALRGARERWYGGEVRFGGLVTIRAPGGGGEPGAITLAQLRGLVKTRKLPPYRLRARLRFPRDATGETPRRTLDATWADERSGGPVTITGLTPAPLVGGEARVTGGFLTVDVPAGELTLYVVGRVERVDGDTIVASAAVRDPALVSVEELDNVMAGAGAPARILRGRARIRRAQPRLLAPPNEPVRVILATRTAVTVGATLSGLTAIPLEYENQEDVPGGHVWQFALGDDLLELFVATTGPEAPTVDPLFHSLDPPIVLGATGDFRGAVRLREGGRRDPRGGKVTTLGSFGLGLPR